MPYTGWQCKSCESRAAPGLGSQTGSDPQAVQAPTLTRSAPSLAVSPSAAVSCQVWLSASCWLQRGAQPPVLPPVVSLRLPSVRARTSGPLGCGSMRILTQRHTSSCNSAHEAASSVRNASHIRLHPVPSMVVCAASVCPVIPQALLAKGTAGLGWPVTCGRGCRRGQVHQDEPHNHRQEELHALHQKVCQVSPVAASPLARLSGTLRSARPALLVWGLEHR